MARTPKKTDNPPVIVTYADTPTLPAMVEAHDQFNQQLAVIDQQLGSGEFEITTYNRERVLNECKFFLGQSAQAMLETGKRLILLKEHESHGEFMRLVEEGLGMEARVARRMMQAALKFLDPKRQTLSVLGRAKIYELMMLDDEELDALADGGTVAGFLQSDIDRMSVRELRAALRDARENDTKEKADIKADYEAQEKIIQDKNKKIDAQEKLLHKLQNRSGDWHPRAFEICMENTRIGAGVLEAMDKLDDMRDAILNEDFGEGDHEAAIEAMAVVHYDTLNQIIDRVAEVMSACEEVFIGYKEKARPMLQVFGEDRG